MNPGGTVTRVLEDLCEEAGDTDVVVHKEDGLLGGRLGCGHGWRWSEAVRGGIVSREPSFNAGVIEGERDGGSDAVLAVDLKEDAVLAA